MLQTCLREREEQRARDELHYQRRRDRLVARGVPRAHADLLPKNASDPLPIVLKNDLDVLRQKTIEEEMETRKLKARQAFEGRWLRETEKELYECVEKSHQTRDPHFKANLEAYVDVLCNKLKLHHQSLETYDTAEALEERRRSGVDLGLLRQQDQHLVRCVHEPLPSRSEPACEEVSTETAQSDDESMFLTHCQRRRSSPHLPRTTVRYPTSYFAFMAQRSQDLRSVVHRPAPPTRDPKKPY
ncbi:uncharacterized protein LOC122957529 [Acropora millepora]|uniref:uncharacterized protein LOC122957529 n=1 Tax=Acropora millepora TaxID=45264 RepID=UPI001CF291D7|nr:uncharacterized protein LOC122957529 [Acropora millepora]